MQCPYGCYGNGTVLLKDPLKLIFFQNSGRFLFVFRRFDDLPQSNSPSANQKQCLLSWHLVLSSHWPDIATLSSSLDRIWVRLLFLLLLPVFCLFVFILLELLNRQTSAVCRAWKDRDEISCWKHLFIPCTACIKTMSKLDTYVSRSVAKLWCSRFSTDTFIGLQHRDICALAQNLYKKKICPVLG